MATKALPDQRLAGEVSDVIKNMRKTISPRRILPSASGGESPLDVFYSSLDERHTRLSNMAVVEEVIENGWLFTRLALKLLWMLRTGSKWVWMLTRLLMFIIALLPAWVRVINFYLLNPRVTMNISYGYRSRQSLDVYRVCSDLYSTPTDRKYPVVVFVSGGAWIIGYKLWGFLMGKVMQNFGVVFVTPDYRNFPQGTITGMIEDVSLAMHWVFNNIHHFGGDPDNVTIIGQSAGAHISACTVLEQARKERQGVPVLWKASQLRHYIGISGPYNMVTEIDVFHERGLDRKIQHQIFEDKAEVFSPSLRIAELAKADPEIIDFLPPVTLFHGTADVTVSYKQSEEFADALRNAGARVSTKWFEGKSHTDPILEDPMTGDDPLLNDILSVLTSDDSEELAQKTPPRDNSLVFKPLPRMAPMPNIQFARFVNPF